MSLVSDPKSLNLGAPLFRDKAANSLQDLAQYSQAKFGQDYDYWETDSNLSDGYSSDTNSDLEFKESDIELDDEYSAKLQHRRHFHQQQTLNWYGVQSKHRQKRNEQKFHVQPTLHWNGHNWYVPPQPNTPQIDPNYYKGQKFQQIFNSLRPQYLTNPFTAKGKKILDKPNEGTEIKKHTSKNNTQKHLQKNKTPTNGISELEPLRLRSKWEVLQRSPHFQTPEHHTNQLKINRNLTTLFNSKNPTTLYLLNRLPRYKRNHAFLLTRFAKNHPTIQARYLKNHPRKWIRYVKNHPTTHQIGKTLLNRQGTYQNLARF
ncbi:hypothetical protein OXYTRIMIC_587 [Oxytricha trifallax]|uniref:Uncharacterized protein n=1 Tax=Oxytricha trifallax TaxID=1172189 RepID=A0A073HZU9_9SPIT|nr:hypothetical protein OXYTRIMIC_587 [Oxytricha trifallax]